MTNKYKIGDIFNKLTLLEFYRKPVGKTKQIHLFGIFKCSCSDKNIVNTRMQYVFKNITKSCGCYSKEINSKRMTKMNYIHGYGGSPEIYCWLNIKNRCYKIKDKHYEWYGGRGIRMCDRWLESFNNFIEDMGDRPDNKTSLDRIDSNSNYCKENCRWADQKEQLESKYNNRQIIAWGECKSLLYWIKDCRCKANINVIKYRLWVLGWDTEKSIETITYEG